MKPVIPATNDLGQAASDLCERALNNAKAQLHPLLRGVELERLNQRSEFLETFKNELEKRFARKLAGWQPNVLAVFKFDETRTENIERWDGSIHLLVKVPRLSETLKILGRRLDRSLMMHLRQLNMSRFRERRSVLEVQQVTLNELRHGIGYGAMFYAVYSVPVKVWPQHRRAK